MDLIERLDMLKRQKREINKDIEEVEKLLLDEEITSTLTLREWKVIRQCLEDENSPNRRKQAYEIKHKLNFAQKSI